MKYIFITGGVVSSLGKGLTAASIGLLLENRGLRVKMQKLDPYLNVDPGTMSPYQHGEVYVLDDGAETDLDLGHYERFTQGELTQDSNYTTGRIYSSVIEKERRGQYLGSTVQVVPHITDEIKTAIESVKDADVVICELGGTVGDIEGLPFLEAMRQFGLEKGRENVLYIHLTLLPFIKTAGEIKTKPTQQSVAKLREIGIIPDVLICRSECDVEEEALRKIALFCNVPPKHVIVEKDVDFSIYEVPLLLAEQDLDEIIKLRLDLPAQPLNLSEWTDMIEKAKKVDRVVRIGVVGKYIELNDAYKSIYEALTHAGIANDCKIQIHKVHSEGSVARHLHEAQVHGILVPGGFGERGIDGKLEAVKWARENDIPFFGICLGMQCAVIEFAHHMGIEEANSTEFDPYTADPVIGLLPNQSKERMGGTMRLGAYLCNLTSGSRAGEAYGLPFVTERHRHRYEFNSNYEDMYTNAGMVVTGRSDSGLVEIVEIPEHTWFVGCQFHPEFRSQPLNPHPLFIDFVKASLYRR